MLCGGGVASRLLAATVVAIPNSLSEISVLEYHFMDASAVDQYLHELLPDSPSGPSGRHCKLSTANSGEYYPVSLVMTNNATWEASATTSYMTGPYAGSYSYTTFEFAPQGSNLFLIRVDKQNGYPDHAFIDVILNLMNAPGSPQLSAGGHSKVPTTLKGELEHAPYALVPPQGPSASTANDDCPEVVIDGTPYSLVFVSQLPDVQPEGLVVSSGSNRTATTSIPWGAAVTIVVDTVGTPSSETTFGCKSGQSLTPYFVNALSVTEGP